MKKEKLSPKNCRKNWANLSCENHEPPPLYCSVWSLLHFTAVVGAERKDSTSLFSVYFKNTSKIILKFNSMLDSAREPKCCQEKDIDNPSKPSIPVEVMIWLQLQGSVRVCLLDFRENCYWRSASFSDSELHDHPSCPFPQFKKIKTWTEKFFLAFASSIDCNFQSVAAEGSFLDNSKNGTKSWMVKSSTKWFNLSLPLSSKYFFNSPIVLHLIIKPRPKIVLTTGLSFLDPSHGWFGNYLRIHKQYTMPQLSKQSLDPSHPCTTR